MLQKYTLDEVAKVFYDFPTQEHYLKGISRDIGMAHTSVKTRLNELKKIGIIKEEVRKKGKRSFPIYRADLSSAVYRKHKAASNHLSLIGTGIIEFLQNQTMPKTIVFFGSYQKGEDTEGSDIDLFIQAEESDLDVGKFEKKMRRKIQLHFKKDFNSYPPELKNNIINGIVLQGYLKVF
jgi:predicted nucleotidyltransferase